MLADMYVGIETMRTFVYRTFDQAGRLARDEGGRGEIHELTAASVMYAANTLNDALDKAVQIHGGSGYMQEAEIKPPVPLHQAARDRRRHHRGEQEDHRRGVAREVVARGQLRVFLRSNTAL